MTDAHEKLLRQARRSQGRDAPQGAFGPGGSTALAQLLRCIARFDLANVAWRRELGVTANENLVLTQLLAIGPLTAAELTRRVGLTSGALTTLVDRLEREDLLVRVQDPHDRRRLLLYPTKRLVASSAALVAEVGDDVDKAVAGLPPEGLASIEAVLAKCGELFEGVAAAAQVKAAAQKRD